MPAGRPSRGDARPSTSPSDSSHWNKDPSLTSATPSRGSVGDLLPAPVTTPIAPAVPSKEGKRPIFLEPLPRRPPASQSTEVDRAEEARKEKLGLRSQDLHISEDEQSLLPAYMPPKYHFYDLFPFSLLVRWLTARGRDVKGRKAARLRARMLKSARRGHGAGGGNLPLEMSLYIVSLT